MYMTTGAVWLSVESLWTRGKDEYLVISLIIVDVAYKLPSVYLSNPKKVGSN
jgi:hypothetical protein